MRLRPLLVLLTFLTAGSSALAQPNPPPADPALAALPGKMVVALLAGDVPTLRANCAASGTVVDEFAPYSWTGTDVCARYAAAFKAWEHEVQLTGSKGTVIGKPFVDVTGNRAFVTARIHFTGKLAGQPAIDDGTWTFVVVKSGAGWKATNIAWGTLNH